MRTELTKPGADAEKAVEKQIAAKQKAIQTAKTAGTLSQDDLRALHSAIEALEAEKAILQKEKPQTAADAFKLLKADFDKRTRALKKAADAAGKKLSNMFIFCEKVFEDGQEMVILVTELTISYYGAHFISRYGCKEYFAHNKALLFYERQKEIITELEDLEL